MTLGFSTQINGIATWFVDKIIEGLAEKNLISKTDYNKYHDKYIDLGYTFHYGVNPKLHTMRKDEKNRWKVGSKIHFVINNRTKKRFQFAPILKVKYIQKISIFKVSKVETPYIIKSNGFTYQVEINGWYLTPKQIIELSKNDGFDSVDDFFQWFKEDWYGKLIHWTDLCY